MRQLRCFIKIYISLILLIIMHDKLIIFTGNMASLFRKDNRDDALLSAYKDRINDLEMKLSKYELSYQNLKLYDKTSITLGKLCFRDIYGFYNTVKICTDEIATDNAVVKNEFGLVGFVKSSTQNISEVKLLTAGEKVSVKIGSNYGVLKEYDRQKKIFKVHNIDSHKRILKGERVVTSGLNGIEGGIEIGTVYYTQISGLENTIFVKSRVDFDDINYVTISNAK